MIYFFYFSGRKKRLQKKIDDYPNEFFYGFPFIKNKKKIIEEDFKNKNSLKYRILSFILRRIFFFEIHYFGLIKNYKKIKDGDICIGSTDSISIGLSIYKFISKKKFKIIYIGMGYLDRLLQLKEKSYIHYYIVKKILNVTFNKVNKFIFLGEGEKKLFNEQFKLFSSKSKFIPFGIDENFWSTKKKTKIQEDYILFIGNDKNRNFSLLKEIIETNLNLKFKVLTKKENFPNYKNYKNLLFINSDWKEAILSDNDMLDFYLNAKIVIIPINNVTQPSGQSVCLQAMSCSKCVLISDTKGFWDDKIQNGVHLIKIKDNKLSTWNNEIRKYFNHDNSEIERNAQYIVSKYYTSRIFAKEISNIINYYNND